MIEALDEIEHVGFSVALVVGTSAALSATDAVSNLAMAMIGTVLVVWVYWPVYWRNSD